MLETSGATLAPRATLPDWGRAAGNIEDAKIAIEALKSLVHDAVFLDEDAYSGAVQMSSYHLKLQAAQRKLLDMEHEAAALRADVDRKDEEIAACQKKYEDAAAHINELKAELDNNAVVFKMHYQEIITRSEEISRLKSVIEGLTGGGAASQRENS